MRSPRKSKPKSKSKSNSNSKQIVLHQQTASVEQPVPLDVFDPRSLGQKNLRRSPRFEPSPQETKARNMASNLDKESESVAPTSTSARRSPRFAPSSVELKSSNVTPKLSKKRALETPISLRRSPRFDRSRLEVKESNVSKKLALMAPSHCLRRSPRFFGAGTGKTEPISNALVVSEEIRESKKVKRDFEKSESKVFEEMSVRRSPRFSPPVVVADSGKSKSNSDNVKSQRSKGQSLTSIVSEEEINSNVVFLKEKWSRRSPRLTSTESETKSYCSKVAAEKILPKEDESQKRGFLELESPKSLKPKIIPLRDGDGSTESMPLEHDDQDLSTEKHLRSPRPILAIEDNISEDIIKIISEISNENDVRSCKFSPTLAIDESIRMNTFDKLSNLSEDYQSRSNSTSSRKLDSTVLDSQAESNLIDFPEPYEKQLPKKIKTSNFSQSKLKNSNSSFFIGDPIPDDEAQERWSWRYELKTQRSCGHKSKLK